MRIVEVRTYLLPVETRVPLKFGAEELSSVTCLRVAVTVADAAGRRATGWGETPLSVQWVWPSTFSYAVRHEALIALSRRLATAWAAFDATGHPLEIGHDFLQQALPHEQKQFEREQDLPEPLPHLAALVVSSAFDIALHDAYGVLGDCDLYDTYGPEHLSRDLSSYLTPTAGSGVDFRGLYPSDFLCKAPPTKLQVWHLVGGLDPLEADDVPDDAPRDGYPVSLREWIRSDGLDCLKVKLRGNDPDWDCQRLVRVGQIASEEQATWLSADFNCMVTDPAYVNEILDRLRDAQPAAYGRILYVEQPFPYEIERFPIDVHSTSARKPLFLDESAHDWRLVQRGRELGWSGVALKTCKTQTGALLSLCWAKAHGMPLMVQDLTNPMLAMIPHVRLAAAAETIMGVECNAMQFYPEASRAEAAVHPGLYRRRGGRVDLSTLSGAGFGYRLSEIDRHLPPPDTVAGG